MSKSTASRERMRAYCRERYAEQRALMLNLAGGPMCVHCGATDDLELDHIDPALKSFDVGGMWGLSRLDSEVRAELRKCQVLCHECHKVKSANESSVRMLAKGFTHGSMYGWMKAHCRCALCEDAKRIWYDKRNAERRAKSGNAARGPYGRPSAHGEKLHYKRGCRCVECKAANAADVRRLKARQGGVMATPAH